MFNEVALQLLGIVPGALGHNQDTMGLASFIGITQLVNQILRVDLYLWYNHILSPASYPGRQCQVTGVTSHYFNRKSPVV